MAVWNLWHGCQKLSPGCQNCYVYRIDAGHSKSDSFIVRKNADFNLPVRRDRNGCYKLMTNEYVFTCMTSDFFVEDADLWRADAWKMIKERSDLRFFIITKRIHRAEKQLPPDWGEGYPNVTICCTCENQQMADFRLPIFIRLPIAHKLITTEPMLEKMDISRYLAPENRIESVTAGGESGENARICDYDWIWSLREQCRVAGVGFYFKQTGAYFRKDGRLYRIPRGLQHEQARKAGINLASAALNREDEAEQHTLWQSDDTLGE